jgi:hypothetical protein
MDTLMMGLILNVHVKMYNNRKSVCTLVLSVWTIAPNAFRALQKIQEHFPLGQTHVLAMMDKRLNIL